jgi:hypothetical protein
MKLVVCILIGLVITASIILGLALNTLASIFVGMFMGFLSMKVLELWESK